MAYKGIDKGISSYAKYKKKTCELNFHNFGHRLVE